MQDVKVNGELYVNLLNSAQQLRLVKEGKIGNVRVVDTAVVPGKPIQPNKPLVLSVALLLGLVVGVGIAFLRNMMRRSEEHTSELQSLMRISYAVFCLKKKQYTIRSPTKSHQHLLPQYPSCQHSNKP